MKLTYCNDKAACTHQFPSTAVPKKHRGDGLKEQTQINMLARLVSPDTCKRTLIPVPPLTSDEF